jgi:hypothetical protein
MMRLKIVSLIVTVVVLASAGCTGGGHNEDGGYSGETTASPEPTRRATTNREPSISRPPDSTLACGRRTVTGELGSYCWSSPGLPATCADAAGIPLPREQQTLTVPTGSVPMFDYGGQGSLDSVEARAYPLGQEKRLLPGPDGTHLMRPKGERSMLATEDLRARREEGDRVAIPAELSSGEYVVEVLVRVAEGDASYYFRVAVEGDA